MIIHRHNLFSGITFRNEAVANWSFESDANDNIGAIIGTSVNATATTGKIGNAYNYNGTTARIEITENAILKPIAEFTINFWIYPTNLVGIHNVYYAGDTDGANFAGIQIRTSGTNIEFISLRNTGQNINIDWKIVSQSGLNLNAWNMITCGWYLNAQIFVEVNNALPAIVDWIYPPGWKATNRFRFGSRFFNAQNDLYFAGVIDEFTLFDRLLTRNERIKLYNSGAGRQYPF